MDPTIHNEMLTPDALRIVKSAVERIGWRGASVRPFKRFGFSGAEILVLRPYRGAGVPQILKISTKSDVEEEIAGLRLARANIDGAPTFDHVRVNRTQIQGVLYQLYGSGKTGDGVIDLNDIYVACMAAKKPESANVRLIPNLKKAMDRFNSAHILEKRGPRSYRSLFSRYLRPSHDSRVDNLFASNLRGLDIHGLQIPENPTKNIGQLLGCKTSMFAAGFIHGDLHLSNIVLSDVLGPALIDFAWGQAGGHLFLDFAMLESSMRFKGFPRDVSPNRLLQIDRLLNGCMLPNAEEVAAKEENALARHRLTAMTSAVMLVRRRLCEVIEVQRPQTHEDEILQEYQRTMFLILAGQQKFSSFPLMRTTINLHLLRKALEL